MNWNLTTQAPNGDVTDLDLTTAQAAELLEHIAPDPRCRYAVFLGQGCVWAWRIDPKAIEALAPRSVDAYLQLFTEEGEV